MRYITNLNIPFGSTNGDISYIFISWDAPTDTNRYQQIPTEFQLLDVSEQPFFTA
jgi:hypothetical protein